MEKNLKSPVRYLKGIGLKRSQTLADVGLNTVEDLLYYFPRRWQERTNISSISQLKAGESQAIKAKIISGRQRESWKRRGFKILEVLVSDGTGNLSCIWFNQPYLKQYFQPGVTLFLYGRVESYGLKIQMNSPEFEVLSAEDDYALDCGRLIPVYSLAKHYTQRYFRSIIKRALHEYLPGVSDFIPFQIRSRHKLLNLAKSLLAVHFPETMAEKEEACRRFAFEEFFLLQLPLALRKAAKKGRAGVAHSPQGGLADDFIALLPFKLTAAQEKVISEIRSDMASPQAMQRLLQGDVGCGKTAVATVAALIAIQGGWQAVFMAPTEILAKQQYLVVSSQVSGVKEKIEIALLTSSLNKKDKEKIYQKIKDGSVDLVFGTHALLEESVKFKKLGLVVIDEQHKFGVGQRALLPQKGKNPDVLIMTATPIPRTLAITLYGDLDISVINELPAGRKPVRTLHFNTTERQAVYSFLRDYLKMGVQAYIVYPLIEESYVMDIAGVKKMYAEFKKGEFKDFKIGLVHGGLKQKEQDQAIAEFKAAKSDILLATTVLEVGIDVPNAACMVIEHAERFGLSQLHQLRGRIGRGTAESSCILVTDAQSPECRARVEAMLTYSDGFRIAEEDLKIRGPGEFFGSRQHGLSGLKIGNPLTQLHLLKSAREEALRLVVVDSRLENRQNELLKEKLLRRFPEYEKLMIVG